MADDVRANAEKMWREVMLFDPPPVTDPYTEATTETVFGGLWSRPGLARRDRRLTSLTVLASRGLKEPLLVHLTAALSSGDLTADELHEWVLHLSFYAGWPCGATAYAALREVLAHPTSNR
jgi:4-carboxymuconolactone decarboxylase